MNLNKIFPSFIYCSKQEDDVAGVFFKHTVDVSNRMLQVTYQEIPCIQRDIFLCASGTELSLSLDETEGGDMVKFI